MYGIFTNIWLMKFMVNVGNRYGKYTIRGVDPMNHLYATQHLPPTSPAEKVLSIVRKCPPNSKGAMNKQKNLVV